MLTMCYIPTGVPLHLFPCQKHFHLPQMYSCNVEWFSSQGLSLPCSCSSHLSAFASKARSDLQEAQGDTGDKREINADAFVVLALNSSFVPLIDCLLQMFSVARMFPEQEAMTLVPLASLSSINFLSSATSVRVGPGLPDPGGDIASSSQCCWPL